MRCPIPPRWHWVFVNPKSERWAVEACDEHADGPWGQYWTDRLSRCRCGERCPQVEPAVRTMAVTGHIDTKHLLEVPAPENQDPVQALPP